LCGNIGNTTCLTFNIYPTDLRGEQLSLFTVVSPQDFHLLRNHTLRRPGTVHCSSASVLCTKPYHLEPPRAHTLNHHIPRVHRARNCLSRWCSQWYPIPLSRVLQEDNTVLKSGGSLVAPQSIPSVPQDVRNAGLSLGGRDVRLSSPGCSPCIWVLGYGRLLPQDPDRVATLRDCLHSERRLLNVERSQRSS